MPPPKSCFHNRPGCTFLRVDRLLLAGYAKQFIVSGDFLLLRKRRGSGTSSAHRTVGPKVAPYLHGVSHNLKRVAGKNVVFILFFSPSKLSKLVPRLSKKRGKSLRNHARNVSHRMPFVKCADNIAYETPFTCRKSYTGQTG